MTDQTELNDLTRARECAARGAALLDERRPNWRAGVAVEHLAMRSSFFCVIGQLYGSFLTGLSELELSMVSSEEVVGLGFDAGRDRDEDYARLQAAWEALLRDPAPRVGEPGHR